MKREKGKIEKIGKSRFFCIPLFSFIDEFFVAILFFRERATGSKHPHFDPNRFISGLRRPRSSRRREQPSLRPGQPQHHQRHREGQRMVQLQGPLLGQRGRGRRGEEKRRHQFSYQSTEESIAVFPSFFQNGSWYHLDVHAAPYFIQTPEEIVYVNTGDSVILSCQAGGTPAPELIWLKSDKPIRPSNRVKVVNQGELRFSKVIPRDLADYTCVARNGVEGGRIHFTTKLVMAGKNTKTANEDRRGKYLFPRGAVFGGNRKLPLLLRTAFSPPPFPFPDRPDITNDGDIVGAGSSWGALSSSSGISASFQMQAIFRWLEKRYTNSLTVAHTHLWVRSENFCMPRV